MDGDKVWTAAEIELIAPDEPNRLFNERVVIDPPTLPSEFVAKVRAKGKALVVERRLIEPES